MIHERYIFALLQSFVGIIISTFNGFTHIPYKVYRVAHNTVYVINCIVLHFPQKALGHTTP